MTQLRRAEAELVRCRVTDPGSRKHCRIPDNLVCVDSNQIKLLVSAGAYLVSLTLDHLWTRSVRAACHTASRPPLVPTYLLDRRG